MATAQARVTQSPAQHNAEKGRLLAIKREIDRITEEAEEMKGNLTRLALVLEKEIEKL